MSSRTAQDGRQAGYGAPRIGTGLTEVGTILPHTLASWLAQSGVPLNALQEMRAWKSSEMVRRYTHLAPEQFHRYADVVDGMIGGTKPSQPGKEPSAEVAEVLDSSGAG